MKPSVGSTSCYNESVWKYLLIALLFNSPSVSVSPVTGFAPLTVRVRTSIPRDPANREACLFVVSEEGDSSESCWPLNGDKAPISETRWYVLSAGVYEVGVIVTRGQAPERMESSREKVRVIGN